jgi:opacity protein-like surface antigen
MKRWLVLSSVACLALAGTVMADVRMGDTDLTLAGSWTNLNAGTRGGLDWDSWMLNGSLGYFITDNIEVGGVVLFQQAEEKWNNLGGESRMLERKTHMYAGGAEVKYCFTPENQLVPYIGAQILWVDLKVDEHYTSGVNNAQWPREKQGILWGPLAGLRYSLNEQNDVFVEYQYQVFGSNIRDYLDDGNVIMVGLSHKFK